MNTLSVPNDWTAMLKTIRSVHPEALICGGALRDLDHGRSIKDIDVFVKAPVKTPLLAAAFGIPEVNFTLIVSESVAEYLKMREVVEVYQANLLPVEEVQFDSGFIAIDHRPPVQIIGLSMDVTPEAVMDRVDFGLSQIAYDGETVHTTAAYRVDSLCQQFTVVTCENADDAKRTYKRWERIFKEKYQGWLLCVRYSLQDHFAAYPIIHGVIRVA